MRVLIVPALLAAASLAAPASAQLLTLPSVGSPQYAETLAQQEMARQQLIQQQNQIMALEAQIRTQQGLADVQAMAVSPRLTPPNVSSGHALPHIDTSRLASMPDSALADSNRKVLDAAGAPR
jgi:hypothetical protein